MEKKIPNSEIPTKWAAPFLILLGIILFFYALSEWKYGKPMSSIAPELFISSLPFIWAKWAMYVRKKSLKTKEKIINLGFFTKN